MTAKREWRNVRINRSLLQTDTNNLHVSGIVNQPGQLSQVMSGDGGLFQEMVSPGVFQNAIDNSAGPIDFLLEHNEHSLLSTTANDSLKLVERDDGVHMDANMIDTQVARDTLAYIQSGAIANMSFGFVVLDDDWDYTPEIPVRTINKIVLFEVSAVRFPAYLDSSIEARKINENDMKKYDIRSISSNIMIKNKEETRVSDETLKQQLDTAIAGQKELRTQLSALTSTVGTLTEERAKEQKEKKAKEERDLQPLTTGDFNKGLENVVKAIRSLKEKRDDDDIPVDTDADKDAKKKKLEAEKAKKAKQNGDGDPDDNDKQPNEKRDAGNLDSFEQFLKEDE